MTDSKEELLKLIRKVEAGERPEPARRTTFESTSDGNVIRKIYDRENHLESTTIISKEQQLSLTARNNLGLSQSQFANLLGISVRTLHDWEQGRRTPSGAARTLLKIAVQNPDAVRTALQE